MRPRTNGFTLVEILLGSMTLAIAIAALLGAFLSQITLNEHGRNLSLMIHDANRVLEQIRLTNSPCGGTSPTAVPPADPTPPPANYASWDAWLSEQGKSLPSTNPTVEERIFVSCQNRDGSAECDSSQFGTGEWHYPGVSSGAVDPIRVSVAVCWRHRNRTLGECTWNTGLTADDSLPMPTDTAGVIDSPAMLTTLVTCRG